MEAEEALCVRCGHDMSGTKCISGPEVHGAEVCQYECPACGYVRWGPRCVQKIVFTMKVNVPASENISIPSRVNELVGEIITKYALAENLFHGLLPWKEEYHSKKCVVKERCPLTYSSHYPSFKEDIKKVKDILRAGESISPVSPDQRRTVKKSLSWQKSYAQIGTILPMVT